MVCYNPPIAPHHYLQFEPPVLLNGSNTFGAWRDQVDPLLWFMSCRVPTLAQGSSAKTHTPPLCPGGIPALSRGSSRAAPCKVAIRQRIARSGASLVRHRITSMNVGPNRRFPRELAAVLPPPPPSGDTAQECSKAAVVVPRTTRFSRRFARPPVEPPASARRRHQPGECESKGAQVPRGAFAFASELSNELSVRGDQNIAMHCRKKPRDALSVRTSPCSDVTTHSPLSRRGGRGGRKPATGSQSRMP